jgi:alpha-mannosidase
LIRHPEYTRARLAQTSERLRELVYPETRGPDELLIAGPVDRIPVEEAEALDYRVAQLGERLGPLWATYWFRVRATVPDAWRGRRVDLLWASRAESTLWIDGRSIQGLHGADHTQRPDALLVEHARGGEELELAIELACNGLFGQLEAPPELEGCAIALYDEDAWRLYHDFEILRALEASDTLEPSWAGLLRSELNRFCNERDPAILAALYAHHNGTRAHELAAL